MPEATSQVTWADALEPSEPISFAKKTFYEVTEKPLSIVAYRIPNLNDASTDVGVEAQRIAQLPGVRKASIEYRDSDTPLIIIEARGKGQESVRCFFGGWLVIRRTELGPHLLDANHLMEGQSGRIMLYMSDEFAERYDLPAEVI